MTQAKAPTSVYHYNRAMVLLCFCFAIAFECFILYLVNYLTKHRDLIDAVIMLCLQIVPVLSFFAGLSRATIVVDETGISAGALGVWVISIRWSEVRKVMKIRARSRWGYADSFRVYDGSKHSRLGGFLLANLSGSIAFTQDIGGLRDLLNEINLYARWHGIPLVVLDMEAAAARLASLTGRAWRRQALDRTEVPVAEF